MRVIKVSSINIWATVIFWIRSAYGQDCDRFNASTIPEAEPSFTLEVDYFSCADGEFLTSVDVWHSLTIGEVRWTCSDGDTSYYPEELASYLDYSRATFDVGITTVETRFSTLTYDGSSDTIVFFGDCYIGGYNFSSSTSTPDGDTFVLSGPFGSGSTYTDETWTSTCPDDSYATGVTWWTSDGYNFVNGIQLECAEVTSTCYPPALENQGDDDTSTGTDDTTTGDIGTTESNDTSSGTEVGIIIAAAIGAAVAVGLVAIAIGLCFFRSRRQKPAQAQETEASQAVKQGNAKALPLPAAAPQILDPTATEEEYYHKDRMHRDSIELWKEAEALRKYRGSW